MFNIFKQAKTHKKLSRSEFARTFNFDGKDFTKACVYRACHLQDAATKELTQMLGEIKEFEDEKTINELCASSIVTLTYYITIEAAKRNGLESTFAPFKEAPKHAILLVAFSCLVSLFIHMQADAEGIKIDNNALAVNSATNFFPLWEKEKMIPLLLAGQKLFKETCASDKDNVKEWVLNLSEITYLFVLQWTSENEEAKKINLEDTFASLLKGALGVMN
jgi:hypothetical protein